MEIRKVCKQHYTIVDSEGEIVASLRSNHIVLSSDYVRSMNNDRETTKKP